MKKLIVGLGNPEGKYFQTYHNLGFNCADLLAERLCLRFQKKGNQLVAKGQNNNCTFFILKPLTYMNNSGQAVTAVARKQAIQPEDIIVFTDDLYIDKGNIRITAGGSSGGHNGIASITQILGSAKYTRIRIGIKPVAAPKSGLANYVLSKVENSERELINTAIEKAVDAAEFLLQGQQISAVQQKYNVTNSEPGGEQ